MKIMALSPRGFWTSWRNRLDLLLAMAGLLWSFYPFYLFVSSV